MKQDEIVVYAENNIFNGVPVIRDFRSVYDVFLEDSWLFLREGHVVRAVPMSAIRYVILTDSHSSRDRDRDSREDSNRDRDSGRDRDNGRQRFSENEKLTMIK